MGIYFTADTHFGHANIIHYCNRPFDNVGQMDAVLIAKWNARVNSGDVVFHLGDFTLGNLEQARRYFQVLNGAIFIVSDINHHDKRWLDATRVPGLLGIVTGSGKSVLANLPISHEKLYGHNFVMSHYPIEEWPRKHYGAYHLHGHSHGNCDSAGLLRLDVGVDVHNYAPISIERVIKIMEGKEIAHGKHERA